MEGLLYFLLSFLFILLIVPIWIRKAKLAKLVAKDMNKLSLKKIPELGGLCVVLGFLLSVLIFVFIKIFIQNTQSNIIEISAIIISILIATLIGFIDDVLGWKIGLRQRYKVLLSLAIALPIIVINAGNPSIVLPIIGKTNVGLFFPLFLVPIGIMGSSNGFNMLAGLNGLEAGMGVIILSTMGILVNEPFLKIVSFIMVSCLLAFLVFNWYPAKIFPGDTLTYSVGSLIGIVAILGDIERAALILFLPYFIEFLLKLKGKFSKESFLKPLKDRLALPYKRVYSLTHLSCKLISYFSKPKEYMVVSLILFFEIFCSSLALVVYL